MTSSRTPAERCTSGGSTAGKTPVLLESLAKGALKFDPGHAVARGAGLDQINLAATSDGGGFAVYTSGGSSQGFGKIFAAPFGSQAPTKLAGLGNLPGTGKDPDTTDSCQEISYKAVQILSPFCFLPVKGKPGYRVTAGRFKLNGLTIIPDAGVKVEMSTQSGAKTIDAVDGNAQVTVQLDTSSGPIVLWHGKLHIKLPTGGIGTNLFDGIDVSQFKPNIKGFPVEGDFDVILKEHSVEIPITLKLPKIFGGLTGSATLKADNEHGLSVSSVRFGLKKLSIPPAFELSDVEAGWNGDSDTWTGGANLKILGATMGAHVTFEKGELHRWLGHDPGRAVPRRVAVAGRLPEQGRGRLPHETERRLVTGRRTVRSAADSSRYLRLRRPWPAHRGDPPQVRPALRGRWFPHGSPDRPTRSRRPTPTATSTSTGRRPSISTR